MRPFEKVILHVADAEHVPETVQPVIEALSNHGASVHIVTGLQPSPWFEHAIKRMTQADVIDGLRKLAAQELEQLADRFRQAGVKATTAVLVGNPAHEVIREAVNGSYDLIVRAAEGVLRGDAPTVGSVEFRLVRAAPCPVLIGRALPQENAEPRILAAVELDPSEPRHLELSREVLEAAGRLARFGGNELHILHAWRLWGESLLRTGRTKLPAADVDALVQEEEEMRRARLDELVADFRSELADDVRESLEIHTHLVQGSAEALMSHARSLNGRMLVLGSLARVGLSGFLVGNTAEKILDSASTSVLVVKHPDFVSPISGG